MMYEEKSTRMRPFLCILIVLALVSRSLGQDDVDAKRSCGISKSHEICYKNLYTVTRTTYTLYVIGRHPHPHLLILSQQ